MAGMPLAPKKLPQGDMSSLRRAVPRTGPDDNGKAKIANGSATAPNLPDRDGPAKDSVAGRNAGKPKTSEAAKSVKGPPAKKVVSKKMSAMRASLKAIV